MRPLVVLRPNPGAKATCNLASDLGLQTLSLPLFRIEPAEWQAPEPQRFGGLLLTSANALRHGGPQLELLRGLPVYAIGEATAEAARETGFIINLVGIGGVDDLLAEIDPDLLLLHLCGEQRREPSAPRQSITHIPVYRATDLPAPGLEPIIGAVVAVHSPRAGARLAEVAAAAGLDTSRTAIAAISPEAARAVGGGWEQSRSADEPSDAALLALAARLCNTSVRQ